MVGVIKMKGSFKSAFSGMSSSVKAFKQGDDCEQRFGTRTNNIAKKLATYYKKDQHREGVLGQIQNFIKQVNKDFTSKDDQIFDAIVHAYVIKNSKYPENFDTYIAMQYLKKGKNNQGKNNQVTLESKKLEWFSQKINEVEKHLERISLVKFQLSKNLKELQGQGDSHLWIDHDFIDPAKDTLEASLAQVQDIENRMLVIKATYEDHLG